MTKNYLADLDIASLFAALDPPKNYLSDLSGIAALVPPPSRNALADMFRSPDLGDIGRVTPPPGLFGLVPPVPTSITADWSRPPGDWWYLDIAAKYAPAIGGVYIIWRDGDRRCVRLGQGNIADRLGTHCRDHEIHFAAGGAALRATWCPVHAHLRDGVERFLGDQYDPLVGRRFPDARPITVNLPC